MRGIGYLKCPLDVTNGNSLVAFACGILVTSPKL